jgi:hypothetical protein
MGISIRVGFRLFTLIVMHAICVGPFAPALPVECDHAAWVNGSILQTRNPKQIAGRICDNYFRF